MQKFNGSLIRQFPSLTTGNAAAGVQVSVFASGTNNPATLYATNNVAGAQLSNPLTTDSKGFYAFFAADGRYRLEYNNGFPALEIQLVDVIDINAEVDAAIAEVDAALVDVDNTISALTVTAPFDFNTGGTVTARNQVVLWSTANGGDGREYRWAGALPKTVPPASTPNTTGGISDSAWIYTANVAFEQELAEVSSTNLIGGQQAQDIALLVQQINARTKNGLVYGDDGRRYRVISAVIRNSGAGWFIINDSVHEPVGLQSVSVEPDGTIRLNHNVGSTETGTLLVGVDETFAKMGLVVGSSVGPNISFVQISAPLDFTVNTASGVLTVPSYLAGELDTVVAAGSCTINHPAVTTNVPPMAVSVGSAAKTDFNVSFGATQIVLDGVGDVDGYIRWDGANWQYTGSLRTTPTFSFVGGELTVTHSSADQFNISLVGREDGLRVGAGAIDKTSFKVRFYDAAGAQVTTASTLMKFYVTRRARALKNVIEGSVSVKSGYVPVDAANVVSASGNIWIYGLMVV